VSRPGSDRLLGLRLIALFEGVKGVLVLAAGSGLLLLVHKDLQALAEELVGYLRLNPASKYPRIFLDMAVRTTPNGLRLIAAGAFAYAVVRLAEAIGLWSGRRWAEWLGVASGLLYVPFEIAAFIARPGVEPVLAFVVNLGIIWFLAYKLRMGGSSRPQA